MHLHPLPKTLSKINFWSEKNFEVFYIRTFCLGIINVDGRYFGAIRARRGAL
jgi:hypothetical protein